MESAVEGYRGPALDLLRRYGTKAGQYVEVLMSDGQTLRGLVIPRYQSADDRHIVLKLKSGYNVGLDVRTITSIKSLSGGTENASNDLSSSKNESEKTSLSGKSLLLISTGGTIASRVDYRSGAVFPALSAADLYSSVPELDKIARIEPEVVFSITSENMTPRDWSTLSSKIIDLASAKNPDGVVVMMGTDTLGYASAALSFSLLGFKFPVVIVGAQRSSDRPSSDAALNLRSAAFFAVESKKPGVFVAMHRNESDNEIAIHQGTRVRKNHTSRRDAFQSIDSHLIATVRDANQIQWRADQITPNIPVEYLLKTKFDSSVALVKFHPGFDPGVLDYLADQKQIKGIIVEGTGLGHVSDGVVSKIAQINKAGVFVGITSQCIWGHVDLFVYGPGRDLISAGGVPLENMFAETAFAKLSWVVGNFPGRTKELMLREFIGEFNARIPLSSKMSRSGSAQ